MSEIAKSLASSDTEFFKSRGFGGRLDFGLRPAILVIDLSRGFTDAARPLGSDLSSQIATTNVLIQAARLRNVPVIFSTVRYEAKDLRDAGLWCRKMRGQLSLHADGDGHELDPRLLRREEDAVLYKKYASCFFGSDLTSRLVNEGIDTLIITGTSTSGCVRATVVDAVQIGFRPMVVAEGVGDRSHASHQQSLFDIDTKYGDVVSLSEAERYLLSLPAS